MDKGLNNTAIGSKTLAGGRRVHAIVAISYNRGVVLAEPYEKRTGTFFAKFVTQRLPHACTDAQKQSRRGRAAKMILMDNDPCQNSLIAREGFKGIGASLIKIPARSLDLNPIENVFNTVKRDLDKEAITRRITKRSLCRIH